MNVSNCVENVERRGNVYYLRWRVPAKFRKVETRAEINQSLKTRDETEARGLAVLKKKALQNVWNAKLLNKTTGPSVEAFSASVALLEEFNIPYIPIEALLSGSVENLVSRIERFAQIPTDSPVTPAALGVCDMPHVRILEMPKVMEERCVHKIRGKNHDQLRQWRNRYKHAARIFSEVVSNKNVHEITEEDVRRYHQHWQDRVDSGSISDDQAVKRLRYLRQMIAEYHKLAGTLPSQVFNPVDGFKITAVPKKGKSTNQGGKPSLPKGWVKDFVSGKLTAGIETDERIDLGIVLAETGCRQTEIAHVPPEDIILDHPIPHILIRYVEEGEHVRDIKNTASIRAVPLLGASLDAMRRHPDGFSRYRGKGSFSGDINNFMRDNDLFPKLPEGKKKYTFGGTRHTWEERGRAARLSNEERAFLLGHSVGKIRGRPVYGDGPELKLRALYAELLTYPTDTWQPRPKEEVWRLIEDELANEDYLAE
jgi:integrase